MNKDARLGLQVLCGAAAIGLVWLVGTVAGGWDDTGGKLWIPATALAVIGLGYLMKSLDTPKNEERSA